MSSFLRELPVAGPFSMPPAPQEEVEGVIGRIQTRAVARYEP